MDRALTELAEATVGLNSELQWTLSEEITKRQMEPVFTRCASGELSPEQALDVCMDCMSAKIHFIIEVFDKLYLRLSERLSERYGDVHFPCMLELQEVFMGLENTMQWSTSTEIARSELRPMFERVANGTLGPRQGLDVFVDSMAAKRDYTLSVIKDLVLRLAVEINTEMNRNSQVRVEDDPS